MISLSKIFSKFSCGTVVTVLYVILFLWKRNYYYNNLKVQKVLWRRIFQGIATDNYSNYSYNCHYRSEELVCTLPMMITENKSPVGVEMSLKDQSDTNEHFGKQQ